MRILLRLLPALLILAAAAAAYGFGLQRMLDWQVLAARQAELRDMVAAAPLRAALLYGAAYAIAVAASFPIAALLTVSGGLLFGTALGTVLAVIGATAGASVTFMAVRTAFAPLLAGRGGGMIERLGPRLRRDGLSYMLVLRLLPVVPFWLVNIAAGMSGIAWRVFALGTVLGIIPATAVYSSIGAGLGAVLAVGGRPDLGVIFTAPVLLPLVGLAALSLLPVVWRQWRGRDGAV